MKRNNIYLLVLTLAFGWGIGACTHIAQDDTPAPPTKYEEGFLSFRMGIPAPETTRSTDPGTADEWEVNKVWVLLYGKEGAETGKLLYAYDLDVSNRQAPGFGHAGNAGLVAMAPMPVSDAPTQYSFVSVAQKVDQRPYWMVVIANPGYYAETAGYLTKFSNKGDGTLEVSDKFYTLAGLQKPNGDDALSQIELFLPYASHFYFCDDFYENTITDPPVIHQFLMSNANGLVPVAQNDIRSSADAAQLNPVAVGIDRAVARVIVSAESAGTSQTTTGGTVTSLSWGLKNINKKSYLYRRYAPLFDPANAAGKYLGAATSEQDHATSIAANRKFIYATDPNFEKTAQSGADFWDQEIDLYKPWNAYNAATETEFFYVTENTMSLETQTSLPEELPYTTSVGIRAFIAYAFDRPSKTGSYYSYSYEASDLSIQHRVFTLDEAKSWLEQGGSNIPDEMGTAFWPVLRASSFFEYTTSPNEIEEPIEDSRDSEYHTHVILDDQKTIAFHPNGLNEYVIPIKHFNFPQDYATSAETYGYYGVVRNNVYRVTIKSITGPGIPTVTPGNYISADITINPWFVRTEQGEDL